MSDFGQYIKELLIYHDHVVIPGLGGFKTTYCPARVDNFSKSVTPPSKTISFDDKLLHDDDILVAYITRVNNITEEEARFIISDYVGITRERLDRGERVGIADLGYLYKDKAYKVHFVYEPDENILLDAFGLGSISLEKIQPAEESRKYSVESLNEILPREKSRPKNKLLIPLGGVILVILIMTCIFFYNNVFFSLNDSGEKQGSSMLSKDELEQRKEVLIKTDSIVSAHIERNLDSITNKKNALYFDEKGQESTDQYSRFNKFYLVAGSFTNYENAQKLKNELLRKGYSAEILETENNIYRVTLKSFSEREKALKELYNLRKEESGKSYWILSTT